MDSSVRLGTFYPLHLHGYGSNRSESWDGEKEWILLCLLQFESKEYLRVIVGHFAEVSRRKGLKVMALERKEGRVFEISVDVSQLDNSQEFNYFRFVLGESGSDGAECCRKFVRLKCA